MVEDPATQEMDPREKRRWLVRRRLAIWSFCILAIESFICLLAVLFIPGAGIALGASGALLGTFAGAFTAISMTYIAGASAVNWKQETKQQ